MVTSIIVIIAIGLFFFAVSLILLKLDNLSKEVNKYNDSCNKLYDMYCKIDYKINSLNLSIDNKGKSEPVYPWIIVHAEDGNTYTCYFSNGRWNLNKKEETEIPDDVYKDIANKIEELDKEKERIDAEKFREIIREYEIQKAQQTRDYLLASINSNKNYINQCCSMNAYNSSLYTNRYWYC